ncbi:DEK1 [Symbiodinium pilosum]|uniref:DEK1 protein n=1 Tax=Symbiodinium pilosum TaxID=2952 RepID=A0A812TRD6_SYMPI|nr:DEK1 [Symbiodinium pilosum]
MYDEWELVRDGATFNDVRQGRIADCFLIGAFGSLAANRRTFFRQAFVAYDMKIGVYGILMNVDSHFTYVIVDDVLGKGSGARLQFASSTDSKELWVSILEKAFFKYHTCLEMCSYGHGTEATFCWTGGLSGRYDIGDEEYDHPDTFFKTLQQALASGELATAMFREPSKGPYAQGPGGEAGQCGEVGLPYGLHGGHCYSLLRTVEAHGNQLLCFRNPWAAGEWTGPWGDKSDKWTDEMKEACGLVSKTDGVFWMAVQDFVQLSKLVPFVRTFGPAWQTVRVYGRFIDEPTKARAKKDYQAQSDTEITLQKGDMVRVSEVQGFWSRGEREKTGEEGFFRTKDVQMQSLSVEAYEFSVDGMADDAPIMLSLMRENQLLRREWVKRKEDGMNYKDQKYPPGYWFIFNGEGKRVAKSRILSRHVWTYLTKSEGPWSVYINCPGAKGRRFSLQGFAPHGSMKIKSMECSYADFLDKCA